MISSLTLTDGAGTEVAFMVRPALRVSNVIGLPGLGFAGPRDSVTSRPSYHGSVTRSRWVQAGLVTVEGIVVGADAGSVRRALDTLKRALYDAVAAPRRLAWVYEDGLALQARARLVEGVDVAQEALGRILRYQAHFRLDDPRGYSQTQQIVSGSALSASTGGKLYGFDYPFNYNADDDPGAAVVENAGTIPTPATFRVYGACTAPTIRLMTTGEQVRLTGDVGPSDYLEIDVRDRTVKLNGTTPRQGHVDSASTTWFEIPPGQHVVTLLSNTFDTFAHIDVYTRDAYL